MAPFNVLNGNYKDMYVEVKKDFDSLKEKRNYQPSDVYMDNEDEDINNVVCIKKESEI